jgi:hypothetical protein
VALDPTQRAGIVTQGALRGRATILLLTLCNAMGVPATTFGNPKFCTDGPIKEIIA